MATFEGHVYTVILLRADFKMSEIHARRIVADMQNFIFGFQNYV